MHIGVVCPDCQGKALQHHGLSDTRWRDDETALSHPEGRNQIHGTGRRVHFAGLLEVDAPVWEHGGQLVEFDGALPFLRGNTFDRRDIPETQAPL